MPESAAALAQSYHQRTKHQLQRYANGPETLDWDAQPNPFRRYPGAALLHLPLAVEAWTTPWDDLFTPSRIASAPLSRDSLGALFELSLALAAWKQAGPDRWAVRVNPSSGNLHPTEGWLICQGLAPADATAAEALPDGVYHYAPHEHALEQRATTRPAAPGTPPRAFVALSSIQWREAWKYGERAFRYCQLDTGHAIGALRYAAALLGWRLRPVACGSAELAQLLGLDRAQDFGRAEPEEPEALFELVRQGGPCAATATMATVEDPCAPWGWLTQAAWMGTANRLDTHPMYRWPVIDEVAQATRQPASPSAGRPQASPAPQAGGSTPAAAPASAIPASAITKPAALIIRQRRSAQRFDARARLPLAQLWPLLAALNPQCVPFDALGDAAQPQVHVLLFAHRVDGLPPGAYLLPRSAAGLDRLRAALSEQLLWEPVADAPADVPLFALAHNPTLAGTLRTLNCHQALGSDAILGFALLAEFNPLPEPSAYRARLQEAGLIGQVLYLQAEAMGLAGTGIGCFFDDALHELIGLQPADAARAALQSVYHFTIGQPVLDPRIGTEPAYAHLAHLAPQPGAPHD
jgi:SagB-type dehydrogenase family enzyme